MPDITTQADIKILIDSFYDRVRNDAMLGYIFNDVAHINWEHHLPRMYAFWEFLLLGKDTYRGNPFDVHKKLNGKVQLEKTHFDRWIELFTLSVDEQFAGLNAEEAKNKARLSPSPGFQNLQINKFCFIRVYIRFNIIYLSFYFVRAIQST